MQTRTWAVIVVGVILLSAATGLVLLALGRQPAAVFDPTPSPTAVPLPTATPIPSSAPLPSPTPGPLLYIVQEGDTMADIAAAHGVSLEALVAANALTDPDLIHAGQAVVIPGAAPPAPPDSPTPALSPTTWPTVTPLPTPTISGPPLVEIAAALGADDPEAEVMRVRNQGGMVSLEGWTLSDANGNCFTFPRLVLFSGSEVNVHSGLGQSTPLHLYWGRTASAWESGELSTLRDREGIVVDTYIVP